MSISVIILTHNEEEMLPECLESVKWADEIVVVDKRSRDKTLELAKQYQAKIVEFDGEHFDEWRNVGLYHASGEWVLYIDPDERVTAELKDSMFTAIQSHNAAAFRMPRKNYWWGKAFRYCGAWPDYVTRLFEKSTLVKWQGIIHESPVVNGDIDTLTHPLLHYTHRDLVSGLRKSYHWTRMEAQLMFEANHPSVTWWRLGKVTLFEFMRKYVVQKGFFEGTPGFIESAVQAWNRFMVYEQLWEMQQKGLEKKHA